MAKKNKNTASAPGGGAFPQANQINPAMSAVGMPMADTYAQPQNMMFPPSAQHQAGKKGKKEKKTKPSFNMTPEQMAALNLSPEQMAQMQLEEAVKEGQNPAMRLKKLKNPISVGNCFLNLFFLFVLSLVLVFVIAGFFYVDKFSLGTLFKNMFDEFGLTKFFKTIGDWFASWGK
jgi:hypothetical protein